MANRWPLIVAVAAATSIGCEAPNSISGTVAGFQLAPREATLYEQRFVDGTGMTVGWFDGIIIDDQTAACPLAQANREPSNWSLLQLILPKTAQGAVLPAGIYSVDPFHASAVFARTDSRCMPQLDVDANSGSITVDSSTWDDLRGSFDLVFRSDRVTGHFQAVRCAFDMDATRSCGG
jgi:hypothetical protein